MTKPVSITKLSVPTYKTQVWIVVSKSLHDAVDAVEDKINTKVADYEFVKTMKALTFRYETDSGAPRIIIFLKPNTSPGIIAHECKHAINFVFAWVGVKLSTVNDESECYMLGWLVDKAHSAIKAFKK